MKFAGVIAAAGMSRRMKEFKPLMELNGFPMVAMTAQSMRNAGIRDITVVTGFRGREVAETLRPLGVSAVENLDYASTDMLASVRIGLERAAQADGIFFLPGDVPLTEPALFRELAGKAQQAPDGCCALIPVSQGKPAHPPLLLREGIKSVLNYQGDFGLSGALAQLPRLEVEIDRKRVPMDADLPGDFAQLRRRARECRGISRALCERLYEETGLPAHIRAHCLAVGDLSGWMAERLTEHGAFLDIELCRSGGYLHDLMRLAPDHAAAVADFLRARGYLALADVVAEHMSPANIPESVCDEAAIVFLADKLIKETKRVTFRERYRKALQYRDVKARVLRDVGLCERLTEEFEVMTGERLYGTDLSE